MREGHDRCILSAGEVGAVCSGPFYVLGAEISGKEVKQVLKERKPEHVEFGEKMRMMRKAKRMSQKERADALDTDYRVVSRYETGEAEMGVILYQKMLAVFGVSSLDEQPQADTADLLQLWGELTPENRQQLMSLASMMRRAQEVQ